VTNLNLDGLFKSSIEIRCTDPQHNYRNLTGWRWFLYIRLGNSRFVRRLIGGKWEHWLLSREWGTLWLPVNDWSTGRDLPPFVTKGRPIASEEWPKPPVIDGSKGPYR